MVIVDILQQLGLTKYEAEAYYTLLREGPLTGYEVGKRSAVPLSRSYEVLERMSQKGLALVQPGDPPRYLAQDPTFLVEKMRTTMADALDELTDAFAVMPAPDINQEFWVLRNRDTIVTRARAMVGNAEESLSTALPTPRYMQPDSLPELAAARRNRSLTTAITSAGTSEVLVVLVDDREVLVGTVAPPENCQAVVSGNTALLEVAQTYLRSHASLSPRVEEESWVAWEDEKHRQLLHMSPRHDVA